MNITKFMNAGYACVMVESSEIKRASKNITVDSPFKKENWNVVDGLNGEDNDPIAILQKVKEEKYRQTVIVLENYDFFFGDNIGIIQSFLNSYPILKEHQTCLAIVGHNISKIPTVLKELIPIIQFGLPSEAEIREIMDEIIDIVKDGVIEKFKENSKEYKEYDFSVHPDALESCKGMTYEEIENVVALSMIEKKRLDIHTILDRKRQIIRATGFMDFMPPEPIENLGGFDQFKDYIYKRKEAFEEGSIKPKLRSILLVGIPGCGKTLSVKCVASVFDWPAVVLDIGSLKGGIVGETEKNTRLATKTIDAFGKAVVCIDEIEKAFAGGVGQSLDSGVSAGILGHFLTWMQERKSEGVLIATSNNLDALPPEFLRAGRWDAIFFVDTPNKKEIKQIIEIMNRKWKSKLPIDDPEFIENLKMGGWTGAEIEQLAKDSHFDDIETAMETIPRLAIQKKEAITKIREQANLFRKVATKETVPLKAKLKTRTISTGDN